MLHLQSTCTSGMPIPSLLFPLGCHHAPFLRFPHLWLRHPPTLICLQIFLQEQKENPSPKSQDLLPSLWPGWGGWVVGYVCG